ncbi:MAG: hypothetical protein IJ175_05400 [Clostridia bacterium]|nr:hypothetical protein [Clostridia bacterium]MBQ8129666.1 hypothetical protein [Clostridia bacterium]
MSRDFILVIMAIIVLYVFARMANLADRVYEIECYCRNLMSICKRLGDENDALRGKGGEAEEQEGEA